MSMISLSEVGKVLSTKNRKALADALAALTHVLAVAQPELSEEDIEQALEQGVNESLRRLSVDEFTHDESAVMTFNAETVPLVEARAIGPDGNVPIKVITPGWGTSGYYSEDVLKRDGPNAYPAGTQMYWNHPTETEEAERPERDLRDLAAKTTSDAKWLDDGPAGPGLYAEAQVFGSYKDSVEELAPHIGVSIRGSGHAYQGEADGRSGFIVESIDEGASIDFVTQAGRGGEVLQLFEAAGRKAKALQESQQAQGEDDVSEVELAEARQRAEAAETENVRLKETLAVTRAGTIVSSLVNASELHDLAKARLSESLVKGLPLTDEGTLDEKALTTKVEEAVKQESDYIAKVAGAESGDPVEGMGDSTDLSESGGSADDIDAELTEAFGALGLSESEAKVAVNGRAN